MAAKTKHYILKKGVRMSYVDGGRPINLVGDGKGTVTLEEGQAEAFKDKLSGESAEVVEFGPVEEAVEGESKAAGEASEGDKDAGKAPAADDKKPAEPAKK